MDDSLTRRRMLEQLACGAGALSLPGALSGSLASSVGGNPLSAKAPMFPARIKRMIFLFMQGGPSHLDTFDYKPELARRDGQTIDFTGVRFGTFGKKSKRTLLGPLWKFRQHGECGRYVSELFPHQAKIVDKLCFVHSMKTNGVAHGPTTLFMHTGSTSLIRPSLGSWLGYGLGALNPDMPAFVSLFPSSANGGPRNYGNAFLPAAYQGTAIGRAGLSVARAGIRNIANERLSDAAQARQFQLLQALNRQQRNRVGRDDRLDAELGAMDLAYRMQSVAPHVMDLSVETAATRALYGIGEEPTDDFGRQCLLARRLCESGVRVVQVNYADQTPNPMWDQHSNMPKHADHARATDKPVAGLLVDLASRGLLDDTLVWWGGEFGRTPFAQAKDGRDHNPGGFTVWLAGGGVKEGHAHGQTDEIGHYATEDPVHMHDLHATILHMFGLDHQKLTYRHAGRDFRLTDIHGDVITKLFA